jgi:hypothetical protein
MNSVSKEYQQLGITLMKHALPQIQVPQDAKDLLLLTVEQVSHCFFNTVEPHKLDAIKENLDKLRTFDLSGCSIPDRQFFTNCIDTNETAYLDFQKDIK